MKLIKYYHCCLSQVFFIKKLVSPDHHVEVQQHRPGLPTQHTHTRPTHPTHPHTHPPRKRKKKRERRRGKGDPHHITPRTTKHPLITRTHTTHHIHTTHKGKEEKGKGKRGPFVCGLGTMCDTSVGCKRICCGAGVMWCSAGEKKRERVEGKRGERVEEEKGEIYYIKNMEKG